MAKALDMRGGFLINEMSKTPFQFADPTLHIESIKLAYQIFMLPAPCFDWAEVLMFFVGDSAPRSNTTNKAHNKTAVPLSTN